MNETYSYSNSKILRGDMQVIYLIPFQIILQNPLFQIFPL